MRIAALALLVSAACDEPEPNPCDDAPTVTWETFGQGFVIESCQPCHASTVEEGRTAPVGVVFDSESDVWDQADRVLARVLADDASRMPPSGGVSADDKERLEIWLTCDAAP